MGLETAKRGLSTQQSALYTTGHNIANANTEGFSRQRANMETTTPYPSIGMNRPQIPGQIGTGVQIGSIQRIRDQFIDTQYRQENNNFGYWESRAEAISQMEEVLNEPSEQGLSKAMDQFWQSLQDLSVNPENKAARDVVVQRGVSVSETFNYISNSINKIKDNLGNEIGVSLQTVNSTLSQIADINRQIQEVEPNGYLPNDLYDKRDLLLDQLSLYIDVKTSYTSSGGQSLSMAEGVVNLSIADGSGGSIELVKGKENLELRVDPSNPLAATSTERLTPIGPITNFKFVQIVNGAETPKGSIVVGDLTNGKMKSLVDSFGYGTTGEGIYPEMLSQLDTLAKNFSDAINKQHKLGYGLDPSGTTPDFFVINAGSPQDQ